MNNVNQLCTDHDFICCFATYLENCPAPLTVTCDCWMRLNRTNEKIEKIVNKKFFYRKILKSYKILNHNIIVAEINSEKHKTNIDSRQNVAIINLQRAVGE